MRYTCKQVQDNFGDLAKRNTKITIFGHCRTIRDSKKIVFIELNDGTMIDNIQLVLFKDKVASVSLTLNSVITIEGKVKLTPKRKQKFEVIVSTIGLLNKSSYQSYPLQKKLQTLEYLRTIQEYRLSTKTMQYVYRMKQAILHLIREYFEKENFMWIHSPIITTNDAEGAGEVFEVKTNKGYFSKKTYLTVSGQLNAEIAAQSFHKVYTFGPTFRAEKSDTPFHVAEFWMLEPEVSFFNIDDIINEAKNFLSWITDKILNNFSQLLEKLSSLNDINLIDRLKQLANMEYIELTYKQAQDILKNVKAYHFKNANFNFGDPLQKEHEQYLCRYYNQPIIIRNFPLATSPFYMYDNGDKTSRSFDVLIETIGEIIGGSQREDRYHLLKQQIEKKSSLTSLGWYLDMRKHGYAPSSGYGLGFERLVMYLTGMKNIRDVQMFPRAYKHIAF